MSNTSPPRLSHYLTVYYLIVTLVDSHVRVTYWSFLILVWMFCYWVIMVMVAGECLNEVEDTPAAVLMVDKYGGKDTPGNMAVNKCTRLKQLLFENVFNE